MAMIKCHECSEEISDSAAACPKCGAKKPRIKIWRWIIGAPVAVFVAMLIYGSTIPAYKSEARQVREVCYKIAALHDRHICDENYEAAISRGESTSNR